MISYRMKQPYLNAAIGYVVRPNAATETVRECVQCNPLATVTLPLVPSLSHDSTDVPDLKKIDLKILRL